MPNSRPPQYHTWIVLAITLLGFALRLYGLGVDSLWFDEILTARTAQDDLASIWRRQIELSDHPPALYVLTHACLWLGESEFVVRLPAALAAVLAIPLLYQLAIVWGEPEVGLWSALLLALSPFHIRYAQEARHYTLVVTLSVASLLFLYRGLKDRGKGNWLGFALVTALNLYTHYSALVVLASELILAAVVLATAWVQAKQTRQPIRSVFAALGWLLASLLFAAALYGPWVPHLRGHLVQNLGSGAFRSTADTVSLGAWVKNAFFGFSPARWLAGPLAALCVICVITSLRSRRLWDRAWLILIWLTVPFFLIKLMDVRRYPFAKYVAYLLPVYLMGGAAGIQVLLRSVVRFLPRVSGARSKLLPVAIALLMVLSSAARIRDVYARAERDWKGVAQYLTGFAHEGDVFITATLDLPNNFNQGWYSLPYYLEKAFESFYLLPAGHIAPDLEELDGMVEEAQQVWALILDRIAPVQPDDPNLQVVPFEGDLYLVHITRPSGSVLGDCILLFEALAPQAHYPRVEQDLLLDLATLYHAAARYESANEAIERAVRAHPATDSALPVLKGKTYLALLKSYLAAARQEDATAIAHKLLVLDAKNEDALKVLTAYDFIQNLPKAEIDAPQDFEHVDNTRTYTMPQTGDWMRVLFAHPPAEVSYPLALPEPAVELRFGVAMAPQSWGWGGDGSTFIVRLRTSDGEVHELFSQHVSNQAADQKWHRTAIDLSPFAGQDVIIAFATEPGPQGDLTGDWAGWGAPRLVWAPPK